MPPRVAAAAAILACFAVASSCSSFGTATDSSSDGGIAVEPARDRDVTVAIDWPVAALDPSADARATGMTITVSDARDKTLSAALTPSATERGPFTIRLRASNLVDVVVAVENGSQTLGYGEQRSWNLTTNPNVPVAVRRRLLYFASSDRDTGQLRALDMAPKNLVEPGMEELDDPLPTLLDPAGLYVTRDGRKLVEVGFATATQGQVLVLDTGSHAESARIDLRFKPAGIAPLGDGSKAIAVPARDGSDLALVDLVAGNATVAKTGLAGGTLGVRGVTTSRDGTRVAAVGDLESQGSEPAPHLFVVDGTGNVRDVPLVGTFTAVRAVAFAPEGDSLLVAGWNGDDTAGFTGKVVRVALADNAVTMLVTMDPKGTKVSGMIVHWDGRHVALFPEALYNPNCCAEPRIFDLGTGQQTFKGTYAEYDFLSAVRLPYSPYRVIVGQSDSGNNEHGPVLEWTDGAQLPVEVKVASGDIGSMMIATPFGQAL